MKRKLLFIIPLVLIVVTSLTLIFGCSKEKPDNQNLSANDLYTTNIIASVNLLSNSSTSTKKLSATSIDYNELKDLIVSMSTLLDDFDNNLEIVESDIIEYETKMIYRAYNISGKIEEYIIYYNEKELPTDDFGEYEAVLSGKVLLNNEEGLSMKIIRDATNYVEIEQKKENNEVEYEYNVIENGKKTNQFKFSFEKEFGKLKLEIEKEQNGITKKTEISKYQSTDNYFVEIKDSTMNVQLIVKYCKDENYFEFQEPYTEGFYRLYIS